MMSVLRIASPSFDVDAFLASHMSLRPDSVWHKGERRSTGVTSDTSGFNLFVAEDSDWGSLLSSTIELIQGARDILADAKGMNAIIEVDFAVEAGENGLFTVSARVAPSDLAVLAEAGVSLCVTVYP